MKTLENSYKQGLRAIGPAHYGRGIYANGTSSAGGIGYKGKELLKKIEELADIEKESTAIGLMMYIGNPLKLKEHLIMPSKKKCLENKKIAELTSSAYYECARVNAVLKGKKILSIIEELEVIEWL